ncbi:MAG: class I SAM-dependent methyltransferase [Caulobacteraceae bacterium]|nr:class I SAM-dependent methyltransferase [Caulobacteraceae bacterium]
MNPASGVDWAAWLARWERFQATYAPDRDGQFDAICRYAIEFGAKGRLTAVDLCAGPGSLGARLLALAPYAEVTAVDIDPFLIELGRRGRLASPMRWTPADLRAPGWSAALPRCDVALCATAMHWFDDAEARAIYREAAAMIRSGGALLVADTMPHGADRARSLGHAMLERFCADEIAAGRGETWVSFWRDAEAEPSFAALIAKRHRLLSRRRARVAPPLDFHLAALAEAGFADAGEVWRRDAWAVVLAVR